MSREGRKFFRGAVVRIAVLSILLFMGWVVAPWGGVAVAADGLLAAVARPRCVGVVPFTNYVSANALAGEIVSQFISQQLYTVEGMQVLEAQDIGEGLKRQNIHLNKEPSISQLLWLGQMFGVEALLIGAVTEYSYQTFDGQEFGAPVVTVRARMVSMASKEVIWSDAVALAGGDAFAGKRQPLSRLGMLAAEQLIGSWRKRLPGGQEVANSAKSCGVLNLTADLDQDSILNLADRCPNRAEIFNGIDDFDGCPEVESADQGFLRYLSLMGDRILLKEPINFAAKRAAILPQSQPTLEALADFLNRNIQIRKVMLESYASAADAEKFRERFAFERAKVVKEALVKLGVEAKRIIAVGYGEVEGRSQSALDITIVE